MERRMIYLNNFDIDQYLKSHEVKTVLLPIGTMEAHGIIPLGTDSIIPSKLALDIAAVMDFLVAPTISYGITSSLLPYSGSNTVSPDTFKNLIWDIAKGLVKDGFNRLVIINGHGGNIGEIKEITRKIYDKLNLICITLNWWLICSELTEDHFKQRGGHGGIDETAMIQAICPETIKWDLLEEKVEGRVHLNGVDSVPFPSTIIYYKPDQGKPVNDESHSRQYYSKVQQKLVKILQDLFRQFERFNF
ncbi:MAG: hypothetical protein APR63_07630 [Desulfuromonas sp. SDB]|nr:MAG: hypothetical protein APR63_07630 [Desulfuromonas sp. SDB]